MGLGRYAVGILIAVNQLGNALTGGNPQESISSRLGDARQSGHRFARIACSVLEVLDFHDPARPDHCDEAMRQHVERLRDNLTAAPRP